MDSVPVYYSPDMVSHAAALSPSARKPAYAVESWRRAGFAIDVVAPTPLTAAQISVAHDRRMVADILAGRRFNGHGTCDMETARTLPHTNGSLMSAARAALANGVVAVAPASGFHHAGYDSARGFCTFNGLAVVAATLAGEGARVGILDFDAHPGDGTQEIIDALGLDTPHWSFGFEVGGATRRDALRLIRELPEVVRWMRSRCDVLLYQAGADPHEGDPLGGWCTSADLRRRDRLVFRECQRLGLPVAWDLAGGYQVDEGAAESGDRLRPVLDIHDATMAECCAAFLD